jgi:hypothetical protein
MRYAEIENNRVRYILQAELSPVYLILPPNSVEIALDAEVSIGDVYEGKIFRRPTKVELDIPLKEGFNAQRDKIFSDTHWVRDRHNDWLSIGIDDGASWKQWLIYWQELRDIPSKEGLDYKNIQWPTMPDDSVVDVAVKAGVDELKVVMSTPIKLTEKVL